MTKKEIKKNKKKDIEELEDLEESINEEVLEDEDFELDTDDINELEKEIEVISPEERIIRVERTAKTTLVLQIISLVLLVITMVVVFAGGVDGTKSNSGKDNTQEQETGDNSYDTSTFMELKVSDIASASKKKEILIFVGRQGCSWCSLFAPILGLNAEKNGYDVYYLDFGKIVDFSLAQPAVSDEEAYEGLIELIENSGYGDNIANGIGTPMTLFVKNGKVVNMIGGYVEDDQLNTYLKQEGFIK